MLGRTHVSLTTCWALGIESSKTADVEGSKVFDLYQAGKLDLIREYNLNDVRVTRKIYERMSRASEDIHARRRRREDAMRSSLFVPYAPLPLRVTLLGSYTTTR